VVLAGDLVPEGTTLVAPDLVFPTLGDKLHFGATIHPVHGSIDAKNGLGIKRRQKLSRAQQSPKYIFF